MVMFLSVVGCDTRMNALFDGEAKHQIVDLYLWETARL
jgi:hypothetical protein